MKPSKKKEASLNRGGKEVLSGDSMGKNGGEVGVKYRRGSVPSSSWEKKNIILMHKEEGTDGS